MFYIFMTTIYVYFSILNNVIYCKVELNYYINMFIPVVTNNDCGVLSSGRPL